LQIKKVIALKLLEILCSKVLYSPKRTKIVWPNLSWSENGLKDQAIGKESTPTDVSLNGGAGSEE
jgi:hypothetical protein